MEVRQRLDAFCLCLIIRSVQYNIEHVPHVDQNVTQEIPFDILSIQQAGVCLPSSTRADKQ